MAILLNNDGANHAAWQSELQNLLPTMAVYCYPDIDEQVAQEIEFALLWNHPTQDLWRYPNLKGICGLGAGLDHLGDLQQLPPVPVVRLIDPVMIHDMSAYALHWIVHFQRRMDFYKQEQHRKQWRPQPVIPTAEFNVGILGVGEIGGQMAQFIARAGYPVSGWSRRSKSIDGVGNLYGESGLQEMLQRSHVLINCLPLTAETTSLLNHTQLSQMNKGTYLINLGRGATVDHHALIALLDSGHIAGAALDVFPVEPLPVDSALWGYPQVHITPHISGPTNVRSAATIVCQSIQTLLAGERPKGYVQP